MKLSVLILETPNLYTWSIIHLPCSLTNQYKYIQNCEPNDKLYAYVGTKLSSATLLQQFHTEAGFQTCLRT